MKRISLSKMKNIVRQNKGFIFQLAIMAGTVAFAGDVAFASEEVPAGYQALVDPLNGFKTFLTGPVAKGVGVIGIVTCGLATASNMEQQVVKRSLQILGGASAGMSAASVISAAGSGLIFL